MSVFRCEIYNLRTQRRFLKSQGGYISTLSAVCDKDAQEQIEALPEMGNYHLFVIPQEIAEANEEAMERIYEVLAGLQPQIATATEEPPGKGEYGQFWRHLIGKGFLNHPGIRERLPGQDAMGGLRARLNVTSLSFASPTQLRQLLVRMGLPIEHFEPIIAQAERLTAEGR